MAGRYFGIPFATTGDKTVTPDAVQPDGSVSFSEGFGFDYERPNTDPAYKPVPRDGMNGLFHDITEAVGIIQKQGAADWTIAAAPYPINAFVRHNDIVWRNALAGNSAEPGTDATWVNESIAFVDTLNAAIATVAAAGTIDLTTGAPDTSQIVISGTGVSINGFTVAANRFFVVKMTGASNTLVDSASLVTGRGANIPVAAGDSFLMRSTAANTVEIVGGSFLIDRGVGSGQIWQDVIGGRAKDVTYTNTTGRSIQVAITSVLTTTTTGYRMLFDIDAVTLSIPVGGRDLAGSLKGGIAPLVIPNGSTYKISFSDPNVTIESWLELRA